MEVIIVICLADKKFPEYYLISLDAIVFAQQIDPACVRLRTILDDIIDAGFRGHHLIEPGSMHIRRIKEKFGNRLFLLGGIDN
jgi:hypothetical protein